MNIIKTAIHRPVSMIMISLGVLVIGLVSMFDIPMDLYPEMENARANVSVSYSGASPKEMEQLVTEPLEKQIATMNGIASMTSTSSSGNTRINVEFESSVDFDEATAELQELLTKSARQLPDDVDTPTISKFDMNSTPVVTLGLVGKDTTSLEQIAEDISTNFQRIEGVASVEAQGGQSNEIEVTVNPTLLKQYNISVSDIVNALKDKNKTQSVGQVKQGTEEVQVQVSGEFASIDEIRQTAIALPDGRTIMVEDVAEINDTSTERETITKVNQQEAVLLNIVKQSGSNTVEISDKVQEEVKALSSELEDGVKLIIVSDNSSFIRSALDGVTSSMIIGGIFAVLVLLLFLRSFRALLVIGIAIPLAVISTFALIRYSGQTLNVITLSGLALGIGMMVDSSIVILENTIQYLQRGYSGKEAALKGGSELVSAVIASTTTTIVVFIPMVIFDNGQITQMFLPMAFMISFSLIAALVVAVTLVPMISARVFTQSLAEKSEPKWIQRLSGFYQRSLRWCLKRRWFIFITAAILIGVSTYLFSTVDVNTFPQSEEGKISVTASFEEGTALEEVENYANQMTEKIDKYRKYIEMEQMTIRSSSINVSLALAPESERDKTSEELSSAITNDMKTIAGLEVNTGRVMRRAGGSSSDLQINLSGADQDVLNSLIEQVELLLSRLPNVENVEVPSLNGKTQFTVNVDEALAEVYGMNQSQVINQLSTMFEGTTATKYRNNGDEWNVVVQFPEVERDEIADVEGFILSTPSGQYIPLDAIATVKQTLGPVSINRKDQKHQYSVTADINDNANTMQVTAIVEQMLSSIPVPNGYEITTGGIRQEFNDSLGNLLLTIALAIFLVYTVMAVQFESFSNPFIVMFAIPTTIIGVILGLVLTNTPLSFPVFIGMIILAGIVVNNAIVLVEYINQLRQTGIPRNEAIFQAGKSRLRPILMTTATTVFGMIPIALGIGEGSETQQPIGIVSVFGLSVSTCFTLIFVPVVYTIIDDFENWVKKLFVRKKGIVAHEETTDVTQ